MIKPVEGDEHIAASGTKHAPTFLVRSDLVGEEHHPELAEDEVETSFAERQILCVRTLERHPLGAGALLGELEHRRVDVSGDDLGVRNRLSHRTGDDAGARRSFKDPGWLEGRRTLGDAGCPACREEHDSLYALVSGEQAL